MTQARHYFGTDGIRGRVGNTPITPDFALKLGWALGSVLMPHDRKVRGKALIAKDTRISGYMFESALESGLSAAGVDVQLIGPLPTPALAYLTRTLNADMGIMISASHNPHYDNGFKFFTQEGFKLPDAVELKIEEKISRPFVSVSPESIGRASRLNDAIGRYIAFCKTALSANITLDGLKIVVDCANGATYHIAPQVFRECGAEVFPIHHKPNGLNINEDCGSLHPESLQQAVVAHQADLGIAFDGDGDRVIMVDHLGEVLDGDELLYIIARDHLAEKRLKKGVVGTIMSNMGLEKALQALGIEFIRANVGDRYVLEKLQEKNWTLGGESSGHIISLDLTTTGDGIIAALEVLSALVKSQKSLHELKSAMNKYPQVMKNIAIKKEANEILSSDAVKAVVKKSEKTLADRGRILMRPSGTEPVIRIMVEGEDILQITHVAEDLAEIVAHSAE